MSGLNLVANAIADVTEFCIRSKGLCVIQYIEFSSVLLFKVYSGDAQIFCGCLEWNFYM